MERRQFLGASSVGLIGFAVGGCATTAEYDRGADYGSKMAAGDNVAPDMYGVGEEHLVFDADSVAYQIHPTDHTLVSLDGPRRRIGGLGESPGEFNYPIAAVVGAEDRLYVLERGNNRVQVFDKSGRLMFEFGGSELNHPNDLTADSKGNIYVADTANHRVAVFDPSGRMVRAIGSFGNFGDELNGPRSVAITPKDKLHVLDFGSAQIQVYSLQGKALYEYGEYGTGRGELISPSSIVAHKDRIFVSDPVTGHISVFASRKFVGRFRPQDDRGRDAVPARLEMTHDNRLYVWTAGYETPPV